MAMPSSGTISMAQAIAECRLGDGVHWTSEEPLWRLAQRNRPPQTSDGYWFSQWRGQSFGTPVVETGTEYYRNPFSGCCNSNFGRQLLIVSGGSFTWSGGDSTVTTRNQFPQFLNNVRVAGYFRSGTWLTFIANGSCDGMRFSSSLGDNVVLTNDFSRTIQVGSNVWTFYGAANQASQSMTERFNYVRLEGNKVRDQPAVGSINGQPPPGSNTGGGTTPGGNH